MTWKRSPPRLAQLTAPSLALGIAFAAMFVATELLLGLILAQISPGETVGLFRLTVVMAVALGWGWAAVVVFRRRADTLRTPGRLPDPEAEPAHITLRSTDVPSATSRGDLETFFDLSSDLLCIGGFDGFCKRVNPAFEKALGYSSQEMTAHPFLDFVHPADRARTVEALGDLSQGIPVAQFESRLVCKDGSARWIEWNTVPARDSLYAAGRDVTERRDAREVIEASHAELRVLAEQQAALRRVATLIAHGAAPSDVCASAAAELTRILGSRSTGLYHFTPEGLSTLVAGHTESVSDGSPHPGASVDGESIAAQVFRSGHAARIDSAENSEVAVPIVVDGSLWGSAVVTSTGPDPLSPDTEARVGDFTDLLATAIANAQARTQLTASRARIVAAADDARHKLERDLHDGAQQRLVSLGLALRSAEASADSEPAALKEQISDIVAGLNDVSADLREISRGIHPAIRSKGGLGPALKALARRSAVPVDLDLRLEPRLPESTEVAAYYVAAEALTNAAKHARASEVHLQARTAGTHLELSVRDDGDGGADPAKGSGLTGIRDRVEALGGQLEIISRTGSGTALLAELPIDPS
ncbi:PAS domain-containing protein [Rhodococcus sp. NPDC056743]|uniref:sensor histidine kinase n=1 Tax=Rhodococcus sp. NPDC056743 TaxID=3345934 RepID=UPI00366A9135